MTRQTICGSLLYGLPVVMLDLALTTLSYTLVPPVLAAQPLHRQPKHRQSLQPGPQLLASGSTPCPLLRTYRRGPKQSRIKAEASWTGTARLQGQVSSTPHQQSYLRLVNCPDVQAASSCSQLAEQFSPCFRDTCNCTLYIMCAQHVKLMHMQVQILSRV